MDSSAQYQHVTLLELLDRLIDKGVMVKGEVLLSIGDIDLVYLNLGLLLSSVKTVEMAARKESNKEVGSLPWITSIQEEVVDQPLVAIDQEDAVLPMLIQEKSQHEGVPAELMRETRGGSICLPVDKSSTSTSQTRTNIDPKNVEKGLVKLVLTLVDLLRRLMEKQAIRRIEAGQLNDGEIEKAGEAFFLLDEKMEELKETFALKDEDLNLDLGPLGQLM